jgi:site-specific DNA-methyltransferase (adenine-specific)
VDTNLLYYGDNLAMLRRGYIPAGSIDLIYLDPPFNSNQDYNVIFKDESGRRSDAQLLAFEDTWHWGPAAEGHYAYLTNTARHEGRVSDEVSSLVAALRKGIGTNQMMAYLVEMAVRLVELEKVLKSTGSIYLHCDPTASHYLKILMDAIFGPANFRSEIVWRRSSGHHKVSVQFGPIHDTILFYSKSPKFYFKPGTRPSMRGYIKEWFTGEDEKGVYRTNMLTGPGVRSGSSGKPWGGFDPTSVGRHWAIPASLQHFLPPEASTWTTRQILDHLNKAGAIYIPRHGEGQPKYKQYVGIGIPYQDIWAYQPYTRGMLYGTEECIDEDVKWLEHDAERLGYPTQKPEGLLMRIVQSSCPTDGIVLDPFCGCGTALVAAQKLGRRWVGIDVTYLAIAVMRARLKDHFRLEDVPVVGRPTEVEGARQLAQSPEGRYQFQWWAVDLVGAMPVGGTEKKGADRGIDGKITFTATDGKLETVLVSVKSGHVNSSMVRDLKGTIDREKAAIGLFITLEESSKEMRLEADTAGLYRSELWKRDYPRIQILTIKELLEEGKKPELPPFVMPTYQQAQRVSESAGEQRELFDAGPGKRA